MPLTAAQIKQVAAALPDVLKAIVAGLENVADDEAVLFDMANIAVAIDPSLLPLELGVEFAADFLAPYFEINALPAKGGLAYETSLNSKER